MAIVERPLLATPERVPTFDVTSSPTSDLRAEADGVGRVALDGRRDCKMNQGDDHNGPADPSVSRGREGLVTAGGAGIGADGGLHSSISRSSAGPRNGDRTRDQAALMTLI